MVTKWVAEDGDKFESVCAPRYPSARCHKPPHPAREQHPHVAVMNLLTLWCLVSTTKTHFPPSGNTEAPTKCTGHVTGSPFLCFCNFFFFSFYVLGSELGTRTVNARLFAKLREWKQDRQDSIIEAIRVPVTTEGWPEKVQRIQKEIQTFEASAFSQRTVENDHPSVTGAARYHESAGNNRIVHGPEMTIRG